jgi:hypothetical protein
VRDDEGLVNTAIYQNEPPPEDLENLPDIPEGTRTGDAFVFPYNVDFEWNYFSCMTRDEVLSFKLNDSDHERTWRTPHCSLKMMLRDVIRERALRLELVVISNEKTMKL